MCISKIWVWVICKDKDWNKDFNLLWLSAKNMSCHSQHLFQCVCSAGVADRWRRSMWMCFEETVCIHCIFEHLCVCYVCVCVCVCLCVCVWVGVRASDGDLGCTCWLVSDGIKSLEMIQLQEIKILWAIRKCVCVCVCVSKCVYVCKNESVQQRSNLWVSSTQVWLPCVYHIWIVRTSTCKSPVCEKVALQTKKASFLSNTCTDVCIHVLGGEFFVLPINSSTCPRNGYCTWGPLNLLTVWNWWNTHKNSQLQTLIVTPHTMGLIKTAHSESVRLEYRWFRSQYCLNIKNAP